MPTRPVVKPLVASLSSLKEKWRMFGRGTSDPADDDVIPVEVESAGEEGVKWDEALVELCEEGVNGMYRWFGVGWALE
jgi:hypothetical protein